MPYNLITFVDFNRCAIYQILGCHSIADGILKFLQLLAVVIFAAI